MLRKAKALEMRRTLLKLGFVEYGGSGPHLKFSFQHASGSWTTYASVPKGRKELTPGTLKCIRRQIKLDTRTFEAALACPFKEKDYRALIDRKLEAGDL